MLQAVKSLRTNGRGGVEPAVAARQGTHKARIEQAVSSPKRLDLKTAAVTDRAARGITQPLICAHARVALALAAVTRLAVSVSVPFCSPMARLSSVVIPRMEVRG